MAVTKVGVRDYGLDKRQCKDRNQSLGSTESGGYEYLGEREME